MNLLAEPSTVLCWVLVDSVAKQIFDEVDVDATGSISEDELLNHLSKLSTLSTMQKAILARLACTALQPRTAQIARSSEALPGPCCHAHLYFRGALVKKKRIRNRPFRKPEWQGNFNSISLNRRLS